VTRQDKLIARNSLRLRLWADPAFAHNWLCHHKRGEQCTDGCDAPADIQRVAFYVSDIESCP